MGRHLFLRSHTIHTLKISAPVATPAAFLNYVLRMESMQNETTFPRHAFTLPWHRADAIAQGPTGPRLEDTSETLKKSRYQNMEENPTMKTGGGCLDVKTFVLGTHLYGGRL